MSSKQDRKRDALLLVGVWQSLCVIIAVASVLTSAPTAQILFFQITSGMLGIGYAVIAYLAYPQKEVSREELILDMLIVKPFPVAYKIGLVDMYKCARPDDCTDEERDEVNLIDCWVQDDLGRAKHPAFAVDHEALMNAYKAGEFHKAMRYATINWLKAILLVARSRGDMQADRLIVKHFGKKSRHLPRGARYSM